MAGIIKTAITLLKQPLTAQWNLEKSQTMH